MAPGKHTGGASAARRWPLFRADERLKTEFPRITLLLLILHGTADKATVPHGCQFFYDAAESKDKALKLYEGHSHDLLAGNRDGRHPKLPCDPSVRQGHLASGALCAITPAAIGPQYFLEAAEVMKAAAGGPPDRVKMAEIMHRHGLTPAP